MIDQIGLKSSFKIASDDQTGCSIVFQIYKNILAKDACPVVLDDKPQEQWNIKSECSSSDIGGDGASNDCTVENINVFPTNQMKKSDQEMVNNISIQEIHEINNILINPVNVLIVDDSISFQQSFKVLLQQIKQIKLIKQVYDGQQAIDVIREQGNNFDIVFLDTDIPVVKGKKVLQLI